MDYSKLGRYLFVSMDKNQKVGSIYYENGRMRLVHENGPTVDRHIKDDVAYFVIPNYSYPRFNGNETFNNIYLEIISNGGYLLNVTSGKIETEVKRVIGFNSNGIISLQQVKNTMCLYEVYLQLKNNNILTFNGDHLSRGYPVNININDNLRVYKDMFYYAYNKHSIDTGNDAIYGCFYGYWWYNNFQLPFNIHNPYEYK